MSYDFILLFTPIYWIVLIPQNKTYWTFKAFSHLTKKGPFIACWTTTWHLLMILITILVMQCCRKTSYCSTSFCRVVQSGKKRKKANSTSVQQGWGQHCSKDIWLIQFSSEHTSINKLEHYLRYIFIPEWMLLACPQLFFLTKTLIACSIT